MNQRYLLLAEVNLLEFVELRGWLQCRSEGVVGSKHPHVVAKFRKGYQKTVIDLFWRSFVVQKVPTFPQSVMLTKGIKVHGQKSPNSKIWISVYRTLNSPSVDAGRDSTWVTFTSRKAKHDKHLKRAPWKKNTWEHHLSFHGINKKKPACWQGRGRETSWRPGLPSRRTIWQKSQGSCQESKIWWRCWHRSRFWKPAPRETQHVSSFDNRFTEGISPPLN